MPDTIQTRRPASPYWMLSFGLGFDEARASNIVLVDDAHVLTCRTFPHE